MSLIQPSHLSHSSSSYGAKPKSELEETLDDEFFKALDPKSLFTDQFTPTPLRQIDLQDPPAVANTQETDTDSQKLTIDQKKAIPVTEASEISSSIIQKQAPFSMSSVRPSPFELSPAKEKQLNKQLLISSGVKIALSGAVAIVGGALMLHGVPIAGVVVKQPFIVTQFMSSMLYFSSMVIPVVAAVASNEMVHKAVGDVIKCIKQLLPSSKSSKALKFSGHGQESGTESPAVQYLMSTLEKLEQFSTQLENTHSPAARVNAAISLQKALVTDAQHLVEAIGTPEEKATMQQTEQFLSAYEAFVNELPSTAKVFSDVPLSSQKKLQKALYHALTSKNEPLVQWAQEYSKQIGIPTSAVSKMIESASI